MKKTKKKQEAGVCPECGGMSLDYDAIEPEDESIYYPFICDNCGASGREYYELTYSETILDDGGSDE